MRDYTLAHLSDEVLLRNLAALVVRDRVTTATLLAHIAEVDARRLYVPAGYPSMHAYCVDELRLSEDAAYKRIQAARAARQFPALFVALAEGRLHLAAACLLAPHLTPRNADELIEEATHRRKCEIEELLALRFPARGVSALRAMSQLAPGQVAEARALAKDHARDVWIGLRGLGCPAEEARRAAEFSQTLPGATLEERMRAALATLGPRSRSRRC